MLDGLKHICFERSQTLGEDGRYFPKPHTTWILYIPSLLSGNWSTGSLYFPWRTGRGERPGDWDPWPLLLCDTSRWFPGHVGWTKNRSFSKIIMHQINAEKFVVWQNFSAFFLTALASWVCWSFSCSEKRRHARQTTTRYAGARRLLYKKSPFRYNKGVQANIKKGKVILWQSKRIRSRIRSGCACIFRKNCASVPEELSAIPLQTEQSSAGWLITIGYSAIPARKFKAICLRCHST